MSHPECHRQAELARHVGVTSQTIDAIEPVKYSPSLDAGSIPAEGTAGPRGPAGHAGAGSGQRGDTLNDISAKFFVQAHTN